MGLFDPNSDSFHVGPAFASLMREIGLDARGVFTDPRITPWRKLPDRENCTLDEFTDAGKVRLHVKRYPRSPGARSSAPTTADLEQVGYQLLVDAGIPAAPLVAWGVLTDGRSFTIWQDLSGFAPGDKLVEAGTPFAQVLEPTAELAAKLHAAGLHHRDLYLCHFMVPPTTTDGQPVQLIDTARVRKLPGWPLRRRWIVKDLAQFWYSTTRLPISDEQRDQWLTAYAGRRGISPRSLRGAILRKAAAIRRHDASLNAKQPTRNVSIPT
jgi:hypothetical protein